MSVAFDPVTPQPASLAAQTKPLWITVGLLGAAVLAMGAVLVRGQMASDPSAAPQSVVAATTAPLLASTSASSAGEAASGNPVAEKADKAPVGTHKPAAAVKHPPAPVKVAQLSHKTAGTGRAEGSGGDVPTAVSTDSRQPVVMAQAPVRPVCAQCGWVESVNRVEQAGTPVGVGAVAGGVLGAVVGNQMGNGNGRTVATILGAVGGGLAGNAVEKNLKKSTHYEVHVRMEDGSLRTLEQATPIAAGEHVVIENGVLRPAPRTDMPATGVPSATGKVYSTQ